MLASDPAQSLGRYALDEGYEVIVAGRRGRGLSKLVLGSCASELARTAAVPVLLIPCASVEHTRQGTRPSPLRGPRCGSAVPTARNDGGR